MALNQSNLKQTPIPVVPRQMKITNPDGTPTRSGQLLLEQLQKTSVVSYGAPGDMAGATNVQDGSIFVVQGNNSEVLYQFQSGEWHYIAGTMFSNLQPDQRPVGLGPNDAGFDFRSIDSDPRYGGREFLWSGSTWIEVTPVRYGTHADRLTSGPVSIVAGVLWIETDRDNVVYQVQNVSGSNAWVYVTGTMADSLSNLPAGLGANDVNFTFATSDTLEIYRWSGVAWVNQTPANNLQRVPASGITTLTTTMTNVPGMTITLARTGRYLVIAVIDFLVTATDIGFAFGAQLVTPAGVAAEQIVSLPGTGTGRSMVSQQWPVTANAGQVVTIQANKSGGTGTSGVTFYSNLSALWVGP